MKNRTIKISDELHGKIMEARHRLYRKTGKTVSAEDVLEVKKVDRTRRAHMALRRGVSA